MPDPPLSVSTPEPPKSLSLPARPLTVSVPPRDAIKSEPDDPLSSSSPAVRINIWASAKLVRVSLPSGSPMVSATKLLAAVIADATPDASAASVTASDPSSLMYEPLRMVE